LRKLTEATLSSYTPDEGDFEEVMRAYVAELNAKIELLQIDVERIKVISRVNYLPGMYFLWRSQQLKTING